MAHVFLSYSRKDNERMSQIAVDLRASGLALWLDQTNLPPGSPEWQSTIETAILEAACMIVLLSPEAKKSQWVRRELEYARVHGKPIFPVIVLGDARSAVPLSLINAQWVDTYTNYAAGLKALMAALSPYASSVGTAIPLLERALLAIDNPKDMRAFLDGILTKSERFNFDRRLDIISLVIDGASTKAITRSKGASDELVRVARRTIGKHEKFSMLLSRLRKKM